MISIPFQPISALSDEEASYFHRPTDCSEVFVLGPNFLFTLDLQPTLISIVPAGFVLSLHPILFNQTGLLPKKNAEHIKYRKECGMFHSNFLHMDTPCKRINIWVTLSHSIKNPSVFQNYRWHIHSASLNLISTLQSICLKQLCLMRNACLCCVLFYYRCNSSRRRLQRSRVRPQFFLIHKWRSKRQKFLDLSTLVSVSKSFVC